MSEKPQHGTFCWNELITDGADKAGDFYTKLLGWKKEPFPGDMPYTILKAGDKSVGGLMAKAPQMGDMPNQWISYITVDDVDATAKQAEKLGGKIVCPPMDIPTVGRFTIISDPTSALIGLITFPSE